MEYVFTNIKEREDGQMELTMTLVMPKEMFNETVANARLGELQTIVDEVIE